MLARKKIFVAFDTDDLGKIVNHAKVVGPHVGGIKFGTEAVTRHGYETLMNAIRGYGPACENIFADLKAHDIPTTMEKTARVAASYPAVKFINLHASAGPKAISAVAKVKGQTQLLAVTVLTSFTDTECVRVYGQPVKETIAKFAAMANECGVDGLICAPTDVAELKKKYPHLLMVTPGVRPEWAVANDQARPETPGKAITDGADLLVIGRPILDPPPIYTPVAAARLIADEIALALASRS